ncbi:hypothetical protein FXO38_13798 [Capsicum annuum]|uniref:Uncharacterized protein n=1 Tax=Capsicum annuum TaxID=4072 RepID=A0A2G3AIC6_CAPAN|nr:hypothetical protein FXO37_26897 [Capsicum annuum]KAF3657191.1 hypothetical protein FXO38_13798 [Capsicum annuum]PHT93997.1 hypothetical protein T459_01879 [Capsicum annuum]
MKCHSFSSDWYSKTNAVRSGKAGSTYALAPCGPRTSSFKELAMTFFPPGVEFGDRTLPAILIAATLIYILFPGPIEPDTEYLVRVKGFFLFKAEKEFLTTSSYRTD